MRRTVLSVVGLLAVLLLMLPAGTACTPSSGGGDGDIPEMKLRWASHFAPTVISTMVFMRFEQLVTEKTGGKITWENYPGAALLDVTNTMHGVRDGIADMAFDVIFDRAAQPLGNACWRSLHLTSDIMAPVYAMRELRDYAPIMDEFKENNVWPVFWTCAEANVIFSTVPINNVDDLRKVKIRANESPGYAFTELGCSGVVSMGSGELYEALERGTIEAAIAPYNLGVSLKLYEVAPYLIDSGFGVHHTMPYIINYELWEGFPQSLKDIFIECGEIAEDETVQITNDANRANVDQVLAYGGVCCIDVGQDELARWADLMEPATNNDTLQAALDAGKPEAADAQALYAELVKKYIGTAPVQYAD
ncbi:MAG: TRAP transporter substrate-binding protein DctP, partial [Coriobacteriia bacterium]|nr:TRAP transporter substrate-binding protein DctP [Coriobacteriia bacterium]